MLDHGMGQVRKHPVEGKEWSVFGSFSSNPSVFLISSRKETKTALVLIVHCSGQWKGDLVFPFQA